MSNENDYKEYDNFETKREQREYEPDLSGGLGPTGRTSLVVDFQDTNGVKACSADPTTFPHEIGLKVEFDLPSDSSIKDTQLVDYDNVRKSLAEVVNDASEVGMIHSMRPADESIDSAGAYKMSRYREIVAKNLVEHCKIDPSLDVEVLKQELPEEMKRVEQIRDQLRASIIALYRQKQSLTPAEQKRLNRLTAIHQRKTEEQHND